MNEKKSSQKDERVRNWTFIAYPDSAPENWRDILDDLHTPWIESPLHDGDDNPNGDEKKPHWHIILLFEGKKSYEQIKEITNKLNAPEPKKVASMVGLVRYMVHLDNPEKHQYDKASIIAHGGADVAGYLKATGSSRYQLIDEMMDFATENGINEFYRLADYARKERFYDWFPLLCDNSERVMNAYIKSYRYSQK